MGNFENLSTEITLDILTRLPTELVLDCKLVCKPWRNVVSYHPCFSGLHLNHLNRSTESAGKLSFLVRSENKHLNYFEYNESHDETPVHTTRRFNFTPPLTSYIILGSFNGLICLYKSDHTSLICNPMTRKYIVLPKCKIKTGCGEFGDEYVYCSSGFGYLPLANEYKVVLMYKLRREPSFIEVAVYTLGSGKGWRNRGRLEYETASVPESFSETGVYANGALHWCQNDKKGRILVYDLTEEKFREHLSPPPTPTEGFFLNCYIGKLGEILYYIFRYVIEETCCDIWLLKEKKNTGDMKELEEHEQLGWNKVFSLPGKEPLALTKSGGVLCFSYKSLDIYDATSSTSEKLVDFGRFSQIFPHMNTLVSLEGLGEGDIKVMESAGVEETKTHDLSSKQLIR